MPEAAAATSLVDTLTAAHPSSAKVAVRMLVDGLVSARAMSWRHRGALYLSVVVKGSFALRPDGRMVPRGVRSIVASPVRRDSRHGAHPSDCVPLRPQTDVVVVDHPGAGDARLRLEHDQRLLIDKRLGEGGFAPVSPFAASRRALAGGEVPMVGEAPIELPNDIDWACFQCAPPDQRVSALHADAWLCLENMHADHPTLRCQLPREHGYVFVALSQSDGDYAAWAPVPLGIDLLAVDVAGMSAVCTWRGYIEVADVAALEGLRLVAGIAIGGPPSLPPAQSIPTPSSTADVLDDALRFSRQLKVRAPAKPVAAAALPLAAPPPKPFTAWARGPSEPQPAPIPTVSPRQPVPDVLDIVYRSFA